jgi:tRNA-splicing endonuclease subunit Sen34
MAVSADFPNTQEPLPIFRLAQKYLIYDVETVSYFRREHAICGVLIGGLPQASQQNVFLGLPLELMPEEARLLVEKGVAYIVDDVAKHKHAFLDHSLGQEERSAFHAALRKRGLAAATEAARRTEDRKKAALKQKSQTENWNDVPDDMLKPRPSRKAEAVENQFDTLAEHDGGDHDDALFAQSPTRSPQNANKTRSFETFAVTPATSYPPLASAAESADRQVPEASHSYPVFRYLHEREGYFLAPGLRFG